MAETATDVVRTIVERLASKTGRAISAFQGSPPQGEDFLRRLLPHLPGMAYRRRIDDGTMEFVSQGCRALTGFSPENLIDDSVVVYADLIHPEDRGVVHDAVQDAIVRGGSFQVQYRIRRVDGAERRVQEHGCAVVEDGGRVVALEGFVADVTEQAELAARSRLREDQFRALVEQSLVGVYLIRNERFEYVNPRFAEIFGYSVHEVLTLPTVLKVVHHDDRSMVAGNLRRRVDGGEPELRQEFRGLRKDGRQRWVEVHGTRIDLDDGPAIMGTLLDITGRKRRLQSDQDTQKMEALGRLSAGVAHDLNNFLALIRTTAQLAMDERPEDEALVKDLGEIMGATDRGAALSRQLMQFGRARSGPGARACFGTVVRALQPGLERVLGRHIGVDVSIAPDLALVPMDPTQAEEIVMNLVLNARDAMPEGGSLSIRLKRRDRGTERSPSIHREAEHVQLEVSDTGVGIPREHVGLVFEPYFTTKGEEGTGLGLSNVWRIVTDAGGVVEVDSRVGMGATFRVFVPALQLAALPD